VPWIDPPGTKKATEDLWRPRIGLRAARLYWWSSLVVRRGLPVAVATFLLIAIPVWLGLAYAAAWACVVAGLAIVFGFSGLVTLLLARRRAGQVLGVRVSGKNSPPGDRTSYVAWCRHNGVEPFDTARLEK